VVEAAVKQAITLRRKRTRQPLRRLEGGARTVERGNYATVRGVFEDIARVVRAARERASYSIEELAAHSGVQAAVLEALEQGRRGITTTQLDEVALALSLDFPALLSGRDVLKTVPSVFLRHAAMQDFDDRDGAALDDALEQGRALSHLRALLNEPPLALQAGVFNPRDAAADRPEAPAQNGYQLAREVRRWLGEPTEPLGDLVALLEGRFGVAVVVRALESRSVTAVGVRAESHAAAALSGRDVHRAQNPLLARVYLAHELCHLLFDRSVGGLHIVVDRDTDRKGQAAEQRAGAFAAELLLPLEGLRGLLGERRSVDEMDAALGLVTRARSHFGTPHEIAAYHLCNVGFVDRRLREWLVGSKTTFAAPPPHTALPPLGAPSKAVAELTARAYHEGLLTDSEARSMLGLDRLERLPWDEVEL
jgi:transcriptional regulator with XRE-family HTH domain